MPRLYTAVRRPVRRVNPLVLPDELKVEQPIPEPEPEPEPAPDPSWWTDPERLAELPKSQLVEMADAKGVKNYGTKAAIIERLTDGDA